MKKRIILISMGVIALLALLVFGKTYTDKPLVVNHETESIPEFNVQAAISQEKQKLTPTQLVYLTNLENNVTRGDVKKQSENQYSQLADFWKDSASAFIPYIYYLSEAAKLENSEKNLTFAARLILENMRRESKPDLKVWQARTAAELYEKALVLNPDNDELKIGLGSCYVYGEGMIGDATQTMKGIQHLLEVVRKDSTNMQAQLVLGIGAVISNQTDRAIVRLQKVVDFDAHNLEAVSWLADAYAAEGDKKNAIKWYEQSKHLVNNPAYTAEVDQRIKALNDSH
ncbi:MAG: tetratricopeptide repeat protein [Ginsengibacter sp.]